MAKGALATAELGFPDGLSHAAASRLLASLVGLSKPLQRYDDPNGRPHFALEVLGTAAGLRHRLALPRVLVDAARGHLLNALPGLTISPAPVAQHDWTCGAWLARARNEVTDLDLEQIRILLGGFRGLRGAEALIVQFVAVPIGQVVRDLDESAFFSLGRLAACSPDRRRAQYLVERLIMAYRNQNVAMLAAIDKSELGLINTYELPGFGPRAMRVSCASLAVAAALPIGSPQVPGLALGRRRNLPADPAISTTGRRILVSTFPGDDRPLALSDEDRLRHVYLIGPTGTGKSTVMERSAVEDIRAGYGVLYIDPKGAQVNRIIDRIPPWRVNDVILLDFRPTDRPVGFNILAGEDPYLTTDQVCGVLERVLSLSPDSAPRASFYLHSIVLSLAILGLTLSDAPAGLASTVAGHEFRQLLISQLPGTERHLREFWMEFDQYGPRDQSDIAAPILRRLQMLLYHPRIRASFGQLDSGFDMNQVLAENKILLVPMGAALGDRLTSLIGSMVMTQFWQAVRRRETYDKPFFAYVDEFGQCLKLPVSFRDMCDQARGFGVGLNLAHTVVSELPVDVRRTVFGNVRSKLVFQTTSREDATILAGELGEPVTPTDVTNLDSFHVIARLMAGGSVAPPLTARTLGPLASTGSAEAVRAQSEYAYGKPIAEVQAELEARHGIGHREADLEIGPYELLEGE